MSWSLGEIGALATKAARGSGMDWGLADEAGYAVKWLQRRQLPGVGDHFNDTFYCWYLCNTNVVEVSFCLFGCCFAYAIGGTISSVLFQETLHS